MHSFCFGNKNGKLANGRRGKKSKMGENDRTTMVEMSRISDVWVALNEFSLKLKRKLCMESTIKKWSNNLVEEYWRKSLEGFERERGSLEDVKSEWNWMENSCVENKFQRRTLFTHITHRQTVATTHDAKINKAEVAFLISSILPPKWSTNGKLCLLLVLLIQISVWKYLSMSVYM